MRFDLQNEFHFQNISEYLLTKSYVFFFYEDCQSVLLLVGAVVVVQVVAKLSTMKLSRSRLDEPGADPCPMLDPSLPVLQKEYINCGLSIILN